MRRLFGTAILPCANDGYVQVYRARDGWRWRRKASNGKITAESGEAYTRRRDAIVAAKKTFGIV